LKEVLRKKLSLYKRKCNYLRNMMNLGQQVSFQRDDQNNNKVPIKPGDTVKVLPRDKIIRLLDYRGIYKGCPFIEEMYDHCDKEYKVLKEASYFYDEVK
jgi:hypothetical protein